MRYPTRSWRGFLCGLVPASALCFAIPAEAQDALPVNLRRLSERVLVTWSCDRFQGTNMAVIATDSGLVLIDSGLSSSMVRRQRARIEAELGRSDFRHLINTHMHNDHAFANSVFPEATVVGPSGSIAALEREVSRMPELLERLRESRVSWSEWAAATRPDSAEGLLAREGVDAFGVGIADIEKGIEPRPPTDTFTARRAMEVGGVRLELFEFTGLHSESDILILVPEERLLFTGDVFWGGQLPVLRVGSEAEVRRLLEHWDAILALAPDLEHIVPGHSDVPMTVADFRAMHAYLSRLWSDVRAAKEEGTGVLQFLIGNVYAERYPEVAGIDPVRSGWNLHQHNIYTLWHLLDG